MQVRSEAQRRVTSSSATGSRIQIHKASMQFHAWKHMIRMIPYDSMHGTMTYRPSIQFHAWNPMIPYMEVHGTI